MESVLATAAKLLAQKKVDLGYMDRNDEFERELEKVSS